MAARRWLMVGDLLALLAFALVGLASHERELTAAGYLLPTAPPDAFTDDELSIHELRINQVASVDVVQGRSGKPSHRTPR